MLSEKAFMVALFLTLGTALILYMGQENDRAQIRQFDAERLLVGKYFCFQNNLSAEIFMASGPVFYDGKTRVVSAPSTKGDWYWFIQDHVPYSYENNTTEFISTYLISCKHQSTVICQNDNQTFIAPHP